MIECFYCLCNLCCLRCFCLWYVCVYWLYCLCLFALIALKTAPIWSTQCNYPPVKHTLTIKNKLSYFWKTYIFEIHVVCMYKKFFSKEIAFKITEYVSRTAIFFPSGRYEWPVFSERKEGKNPLRSDARRHRASWQDGESGLKINSNKAAFSPARLIVFTSVSH